MSDAQILIDFGMTSDECMRAVCFFCFCYAITLSMCLLLADRVYTRQKMY